jgi:hypothetical protein
MALLLKRAMPDTNFIWVCTPTGNEPAEWFGHMRKVAAAVGTIYPVMRPGGLKGLIEHYNALPNWRQRWCTRQLKIEPFANFLEKLAPAKFYVGLRADEAEREGGDYAHVPNVQMIFPLRELEMSLDDVWSFLFSEGWRSFPKRTDCRVCFFQRLIEWYELWRDDPEGYAEGIAWEKQTGYTFRSPGRDTWPASLVELAAEFSAGKVPKDTRTDSLSKLKCRVCSK